MSYSLSKAALHSNMDNPTAKLVLIAIADHLKESEPEKGCWPSVESLCLITGFKRAALFKALRYLKSNGWIECQKLGNKNVYFVNLDKLRTEAIKETEEFRKENSGSTKDTLGSIKDTLESTKYTLGSTKDTLRSIKDTIENSSEKSHEKVLFEGMKGSIKNTLESIKKTEGSIKDTLTNKEYIKEQIREKETNKEKNSDNAKASNAVTQSAPEESQHSDCAKDPTCSQNRVIPEVDEPRNVKNSPYTKESALDSENAIVTNLAEEKNSTGSTVVNDFNVRADSNENLSLYTEAPSLNNSDTANGTTLQPVETPTIQQTTSCVRETKNTPNNSDNHGTSPTTSQTTTVTCTTEDKESALESNEPPSCVKGDSSQNNHETLVTGTTVEELTLCDNLFGFEDEPSTPVKSKKSKNHKCASDGSYELPHPKTGQMITIEANFVRAEKPEELSEEFWEKWIAQRRKNKKSAYLTQNVIDSFRKACEEEDCSLEEGIDLAIHWDWQGLKPDWMLWKPPMRKRFCTNWKLWDALRKKFLAKETPITKVWLEGLEAKAKLYNITTEQAIEWIITNNARDFNTDWYEEQHPEYKGAGSSSKNSSSSASTIAALKPENASPELWDAFVAMRAKKGLDVNETVVQSLLENVKKKNCDINDALQHLVVVEARSCDLTNMKSTTKDNAFGREYALGEPIIVQSSSTEKEHIPAAANGNGSNLYAHFAI